jgi:hypothetical protein
LTTRRADGEAEKLAVLRLNPDFYRMMVRADAIVDGLGAVGGVTGEGIAQQMELFTEATSELGRRESRSAGDAPAAARRVSQPTIRI